MGKWSKLKGELTPIPMQPERRMKLDELAAKFRGRPDPKVPGKVIDGLSDREIVEQILKSRQAKEELAAAESTINLGMEALTMILSERWEAQGISSTDFPGIGKATLSPDIYVSVNSQSKQFAWLKLKKLGALIKPTVHYQSLTAAIKELLEGGAPVPPPSSGMTFHFRDKVALRAEKKTDQQDAVNQ